MAVTAPVQQYRIFKVITSLDEDVLLFRRMVGTEEVGRLFEFELDLLSVNHDICFADVLGQKLTIEMQRFDGEPRYFNGIVSRFSYVGSENQYALYRASVRPWLWFLTRTADCRIFQDMTVPDIIKQVFRDYGFTDFEDRLFRDYSEWNYCVQYRETAFNFVSRLMEHEGIYYFFIHEEDKHTLVLADEYSSHNPYPGYETIKFFPPSEQDKAFEEHISDWSVVQEVQAGRYSLNDYNFELPRAMLEVRSAISRDNAFADFEYYDYPGAYAKAEEGEFYARNRIEEVQTEYEKVSARANAGGLCPGFLFTLEWHPRKDQNRQFLLLSIAYHLVSDAYTTEPTIDPEPPYRCSFTAIDGQQPFRPARITPVPVVHGPQPAVVVGPDGGEIHTDEYGRIKVRFYWDRYAPGDDRSSCWVRVSQNRAGKDWGEVYLPHVGQEVIVSFLEGDPNRPLVTGRVYNHDNMPPLDLPTKKTQLMMRDHGGNEMLMEGEGGDQRITMFSPSGDSRFSMGAGFNPDPGFHWNTAENWVADIGGYQHIDVARDQQIDVRGNVTETIGGSYTQTVESDSTWLKEGAEASVNFSAVAKTVVGAEASANLSAKESLTVGVDLSQFIGFKSDITAAGKLTIDKSGELNKKAKEIKQVDSSIEYVCLGSIEYTALGKMELLGTPVLIDGVDSVKIKVGGNSIEVKPGMIMIEASDIFLKGDVAITKNLVVNGKINDK